MTYIDLVDSLADGPGAVGDLYRAMQIDFVNAQGQTDPFTRADLLTFHQDTDSVGIREENGEPGEENRPHGAPEPSTLLLAVLGLVSLGLRTRRSRG